ncbi:MAG: 3-oxoadipate enol-lactonase [Betaproteobacteria bacterium]|nr:3-oxoadipate enol-lactonase [Betaproteobacteria bacterium]
MTGKIKVGDLEVAYRFDGPQDGPVVLLANSLMSNHTMWDRTVPALADRYRVLRYDKRGHGGTSVTPGPYTLAQLADDAIGLLDALKIDRAHCAGLSIGGMLMQQVGARYPGRVLSLGLCDTASETPMAGRAMWDERIATARSKGTATLVDGTLGRWFTPAFAAREPHTVAEIRKMLLAIDAEGYAGCAAAVRDMIQTTMLLKIAAPTLIITGRQDMSTTVEQSIVLHRVICHSELVIVEDAAHLSNIEQPTAFNQALRGFLARVEPARKP